MKSRDALIISATDGDWEYPVDDEDDHTVGIQMKEEGKKGRGRIKKSGLVRFTTVPIRTFS